MQEKSRRERGTGSGSVGRVAEEYMTINADDEVVESLPSGSSSESIWAVRAYETEGRSVIFVNRQMIAASVRSHHDTDWIAINDAMIASIRLVYS